MTKRPSTSPAFGAGMHTSSSQPTSSTNESSDNRPGSQPSARLTSLSSAPPLQSSTLAPLRTQPKKSTALAHKDFDFGDSDEDEDYSSSFAAQSASLSKQVSHSISTTQRAVPISSKPSQLESGVDKTDIDQSHEEDGNHPSDEGVEEIEESVDYYDDDFEEANSADNLDADDYF